MQRIENPPVRELLFRPTPSLFEFRSLFQAVGFDVTPQALRVAESVTLAVDVKGKEMATLAVLIQLQVGVMCGPLHDGTFGATPWVSEPPNPSIPP